MKLTNPRTRLRLGILLLIGIVVLLLSPFVKRILKYHLRVRPAPKNFYDRLAYAAEDIVDPSIVYDPVYRQIPYPGGDVPPKTGVCSDVVIRAYRHLGIDLQVLVHEDMAHHFAAYPHLWQLNHPDPNIDHRRVYNLATFFKRHGSTLPCSAQGNEYHPGYIVVWRVQNQGHIGIVSSLRNNANTRNLIVHNFGAGQVLDDALFASPIIGHYRYAPDQRLGTVLSNNTNRRNEP